MFQRAVFAVGLLIALAAGLQYRSISQFADAERERLRDNLRQAVARFAQEFNSEIARAYFSLQVGRPEAAGRDVDEAAERVAGWLSTTPYPRIVRDFYRSRGGEDGLGELLRFDRAAGRFEPVAWPAHLAELRSRLQRPAAGGFRWPDMAAAVDEDIPALVGARPLPPAAGEPQAVGGWSIAELDLEYIRRELFPQLAAKHFGPEYEVRIVSRADAERVVFGDPDPGGEPDASAVLLDLRPEPGAGLPGRPGAFGPRFPLIRRPDDAGPLPGPADRARWRLLVRHRAGSLDRAVSDMRWRDIAVSGVLFLLLAASMALVVISTRRAHSLAHQQMEFVAGVSHELRTPLAVILSAADNLADGVVAGEPQVRRYGSVIRRESRRLTDMVEQLLRFSGLQSGRANYKLQPVDAETAIDRALAACQPELRDSGMEIQRDVQSGLPPVHADPAALVHCLGNLVGNALKHAREGGWIGISAHLDDRGEPAVEFVVEDRGPGLDPADVAQLWKPFYRGRHAVSQQVQGAGLGLSLVKRMTEAQGGTVSVTSKTGEGAAFRLRLPASRSAA